MYVQIKICCVAASSPYVVLFVIFQCFSSSLVSSLRKRLRMFLQRTSRVLDSGRLVAANLSSFCRDAIRLIAAEVHAEVAGCDSDAEGSMKKNTHRDKKTPQIKIIKSLFVLQGTSFHAALFLCVCVCVRVSCVSCGDSHENPLPPPLPPCACR